MVRAGRKSTTLTDGAVIHEAISHPFMEPGHWGHADVDRTAGGLRQPAQIGAATLRFYPERVEALRFGRRPRVRLFPPRAVPPEGREEARLSRHTTLRRLARSPRAESGSLARIQWRGPC